MKWVKLSEESYIAFVNNVEFMEDNWNMILNESTSDRLDQNLRLKIIYDLFFFALRFCALAKLSFTSVCALWNIIEEELDNLIVRKDDINISIFANSNGDVADLSARYKQKIGDCILRGVMNTQEAMKITDFFTAEFVSYYLEYKYVMKELHTEKFEIISLEVQLPMISAPLKDAIQS